MAKTKISPNWTVEAACECTRKKFVDAHGEHIISTHRKAATAASMGTLFKRTRTNVVPTLEVNIEPADQTETLQRMLAGYLFCWICFY